MWTARRIGGDALVEIGSLYIGHKSDIDGMVPREGEAAVRVLDGVNCCCHHVGWAVGLMFQFARACEVALVSGPFLQSTKIKPLWVKGCIGQALAALVINTFSEELA